jgi:hypothetical protein
MATIMQTREIAESTRSRSTLGRIDYVDVATIVTDVRATPERWARAIVEHAAGAPAQIFWRAIGLRLKSGEPGHIGGWKIAGVDDDGITAETAAFYGTVNAICEVRGDRVSLALAIRFDHWFARIAVPPVTLFHRRGIPMLLRAAAKHIASTG